MCPKLKRSSSFNEDSITKSQLLPYYKGSGFDRGHLKPADHSKCSKESMKASFLTLNISPQLPSFNRGPWKQLEAYSKRALNLKDSIQVYVGPIFSRVWNRKKHEGITIPKAYYRTLKFNDSTAVGFIMDQNEKEFDPFRQAVPINLIERKTRLDLYPGTPERFEAKVDSAFLQTLSELSFSGVCE